MQTSTQAGVQSALSPHGPEAAAVAEMTWVLLAGGALVLVVVIVLTIWALAAPPAWMARKSFIVAGGIVLPLAFISGLLLYTLLATARLPDEGPAALRVDVVGHQWWWQFEYRDAAGASDFITANELHIPVGQVVELHLRSADVLHSFWVPALAGKLDLIPGKDNRLRLAAQRAGRFRGQCAEYCGGPHGQMAMFVVAQPAADFETWRAAQRQPRNAGMTAEAARGEAVFLAHCASCHTVRGTPARGTLGPDLTHVASRRSLGAGLLPNNAGTAAGWIVSNQHLKPGNLMPEFRGLGSGELQALVAYLGSLE